MCGHQGGIGWGKLWMSVLLFRWGQCWVWLCKWVCAFAASSSVSMVSLLSLKCCFFVIWLGVWGVRCVVVIIVGGWCHRYC